MYAIFLKEINAFFSSLIGYISVGVFLLIIGLFLWVFPDSNVLDYGFASLEQLFGMAPNVFLLLIPAITMRSFAEESQNGTMELLATRPVSDLAIILGKYWACIVLLMMSLVPTLIYYISIYQLGEPAGNIDTGAVIGSYLGLLLIGAAFTAIGLFASATTNNQIVSFVFAIFLCFALYLGFENISAFSFSNDNLIQSFGMSAHYSSLSRGLIDLRDVLYFLSVIAIFLGLTKFQLERRTW
jgi:ABC-2 type transport system permease protein